MNTTGRSEERPADTGTSVPEPSLTPIARAVDARLHIATCDDQGVSELVWRTDKLPREAASAGPEVAYVQLRRPPA